MGEEKGMLLGMPERWDEACFSVPALRALVKSGLAGGIVCAEEQQNFWKTVCDLPQFTFSHKTPAGALAAKLGGGWEASVVWHMGVAAKAFLKAKIARRLGTSEPKLAKLLTHPLDVAEGATRHRVRLYLKTCEEMGVPVDRPEYYVAAPLGIPASPSTVLLCPGSDFGPSHEWPLDRWQELAEALLEQGKRLTVAGIVGGRGLGKILAGRLGGDVEFFHAAPLAAALPLLAAHQLVISADGSLAHLAAHAGSTCVTLFGPNDAVWKRPLGKRHVVLKRHVECAPCLSPKCLMDGRCQGELEVAQVLAAIPASL
jgi:ADP-heptose:LPS heptosyltransferase